MRYQYAGPGPHEEDGEITRPGDVREFGSDPGIPWECIDPPPGPEAAGLLRWDGSVTPPPDAPVPAAPPATPEGM